MDEQTLARATEAEKLLREHHKHCTEKCDRLGVYESGRIGYERCDRGKELYTTWLQFRPAPLKGSRTAPDGEELAYYVVEKVESIGPYTIAHLLRDASGDRGVKRWAEHGQLAYQAYVDGTFEGHFWVDVSLDEVLLAAMEFRITGDTHQHRTASYFARKVLESAANEFL